MTSSAYNWESELSRRTYPRNRVLLHWERNFSILHFPPRGAALARCCNRWISASGHPAKRLCLRVAHEVHEHAIQHGYAVVGYVREPCRNAGDRFGADRLVQQRTPF